MMDPETARLVHYSILAVAAAVWLAALWFHRRTFARGDPMHPEVLREGERDLSAARGDARDRIVSAFRRGGLGGGGSFLLTEADDRRIRGRASILPTASESRQLGFEIDLSDRGTGTRAAWRITRAEGSRLRTASALFVYLLSPGVLLAAALLMHAFVLPSPDPNVRFQAIQTMQVSHFVWPPFLFAGLHRAFSRTLSRSIENVIANAGF